MTGTTRQPAGHAGALFAFFLAATLVAPSFAAADSSHGLVGAWLVQVTLRNCATQAPLGPPIHALVTFHRDGTLSESAGGVTFAPGQRSAGHGAWARQSGDTYGQEMVAMINFDTAPNLPGTPTFDPTKPVSPGFFAGWVTISHTVQFTDEDHISSEGTNAFYKLNQEVYRTGCSTATGTRF
jgi:hypothetical protein